MNIELLKSHIQKSVLWYSCSGGIGTYKEVWGVEAIAERIKSKGKFISKHIRRGNIEGYRSVSSSAVKTAIARTNCLVDYIKDMEIL